MREKTFPPARSSVPSLRLHAFLCSFFLFVPYFFFSPFLLLPPLPPHPLSGIQRKECRILVKRSRKCEMKIPSVPFIRAMQERGRVGSSRKAGKMRRGIGKDTEWKGALGNNMRLPGLGNGRGRYKKKNPQERTDHP